MKENVLSAVFISVVFHAALVTYLLFSLEHGLRTNIVLRKVFMVLYYKLTEICGLKATFSSFL